MLVTTEMEMLIQAPSFPTSKNFLRIDVAEVSISGYLALMSSRFLRGLVSTGQIFLSIDLPKNRFAEVMMVGYPLIME